LKEILVKEKSKSGEIMLQVFWGLLACQILNGKGRDILENTSLMRMRVLIEERYGSWDLTSSFQGIEFTNVICMILHYVLVFSFTAKDLTNNGLFASLLTDSTLYGNVFLNAVQMRHSSLFKYMVASILLARGQTNQKYQVPLNSLEKLALPLALTEAMECEVNGQEVSPMAAFLKAVYEDYDFEAALALVQKVGEEAEEDFLLKNYANDIKKQAYMVVFQLKIKVYQTVEVSEIEQCLKPLLNKEGVYEELRKTFIQEGLDVVVDSTEGTVSCSVNLQFDSEHNLEKQAVDLYKRTAEMTA
jgi:hypothetical protein